jgi:hypothetical protein
MYVNLRGGGGWRGAEVMALFRDATSLNSAFSSAQIARFLYDCYLMHVESVAET